MYTILVDNKNYMHTSVREAIVQGSNLTNYIKILVPQQYGDFNMIDFRASIRYKIQDEQGVGIVEMDDPEELSNGYLQYLLPVTVEMTNKAGLLTLLLTFTKTDDLDESSILVRKICPIEISIVPIGEWEGEIPDSDIDYIDKKLEEIKDMVEDVKGVQEQLEKEKADNVTYENNILQLTANDSPIGDPVKIEGTNLVWKEI